MSRVDAFPFVNVLAPLALVAVLAFFFPIDWMQVLAIVIGMGFIVFAVGGLPR